MKNLFRSKFSFSNLSKINKWPKAALILAIAVWAFLNASCGLIENVKNTDLSIYVPYNQTFLINAPGSSCESGGAENDIDKQYFHIRQVSLIWEGEGQLLVSSIKIKLRGSQIGGEKNINMSNDELTATFGSVWNDGLMEPHTSVDTSSACGFKAGGIAATATGLMRGQIVVTGVAFGADGSTTPITASEPIIVRITATSDEL
ncbi:MAG: hypothetical protein V4736_13615 [Bdellovibrionota bacterium]